MRVPLAGTAATVVYAFLPDKRRQTYERLFTTVNQACQAAGHNMTVGTFVVDFEDAGMRAVSAVFGRQVSIRGCFYHLTQSTWRKVQQLGMAGVYKENIFRR